MFGIDTNVLISFYNPDDDPAQAQLARRFIKDQAPVFVSSIVLAEFVWTLHRTYGFDRKEIARFLGRLISAPEFVVSEPEAVQRAFGLYVNGRADFADYLIGELAIAEGCELTVTFDRDAAKSPAFQLLRT